MAFFYRPSNEELKQVGFRFTALMYGFIPVYVSDPDCGGFMVATRNWFPEWPLDVMECLQTLFLDIADPYRLSECTTKFKITGEI